MLFLSLFILYVSFIVTAISITDQQTINYQKDQYSNKDKGLRHRRVDGCR